VLLLDEPFGSLDRALRDRLTEEVTAILNKSGIAALHVTHDHGEAFAVGDRVALMDHGRVVQIGAPEEVWEQPGSPSIARFLGHANIVEIDGAPHLIRADAAVGVSALSEAASAATAMPHSTAMAGEVAATVVSRRYLGGRYLVRLDTEAYGRLSLELKADPGPGRQVAIRIDPSRVIRL